MRETEGLKHMQLGKFRHEPCQRLLLHQPWCPYLLFFLVNTCQSLKLQGTQAGVEAEQESVNE